MDRNLIIRPHSAADSGSLSARRAWIEIVDYIIDYATDAVALRKESVDRNNTALVSFRAYIVALRKESVDRNPYLLGQFGRAFCRSPQGERG